MFIHITGNGERLKRGGGACIFNECRIVCVCKNIELKKKGCGVPRQMLYTAINYKTPWPIKASKHFEHKREEIRIKKELTEDQEK